MGGRSSKRKGSTYEREFVRLTQDAGLPAHRVPLSGAMGGRFTDDVVVADEWRVECKYRSDGSGFKRLYDWLAGWEQMVLYTPDAILRVLSLDAWAEERRLELENCEPALSMTARECATPSTLLGWIGEADYLAVRMARRGWLMVEVL